MLMSALDKQTSEIILRGEFFEFDKIYFLIERLRGAYGIPPHHYLPAYENAASLLLGLTYEIRRAESGDRELYTMYNGLTSDFLAPAGTPDEQIMSLEEYRKCQDRFDAYDDIIYMDIDMDPEAFYELDRDEQADLLDDLNLDPSETDAFLDWISREPFYRFRQEDYPRASDTNTYLQFRIPFAEGVLYAFILKTLLSFRQTIIENALAAAASPTDPTAGYERDYCLRRMPADLALLDALKEQLLSQLSSVCDQDKYLQLRKEEAPKDFFKHISSVQIELLSAMLKTCADASAETVDRIADYIAKT